MGPIRPSRRGVVWGLGGASALVVSGGAGAWVTSRGADPPAAGDCGPRLTGEDLEAGIDLCSRYLVAAQRPDGDFVYEVDWRTGEASTELDPVRQAGATWGLANHAVESGDPAATAAADRAIGFWLERTRAVPTGVVLTHGRGEVGKLGAAAIVGLALADRLHRPEGLDAVRTGAMRDALDGIVSLVRASRRPEGGFSEKHDLVRGEPAGPRSPYADGEALLLLATLAVRDGRTDLLADTLRWADEDWAVLVRDALAAEPDSDTTKGYYQWGSMTWALLIEGGHQPGRWGRRLTELAVWMIDVHRTLTRGRNTAYAYEGLLPAYAEARRVGDDALARRIACVAHQGLRKLCSWQLGHPLARAELRRAPERYLGGVQNAADESALRIDVTQHQLHALWLAQATGVADHPL